MEKEEIDKTQVKRKHVDNDQNQFHKLPKLSNVVSVPGVQAEDDIYLTISMSIVQSMIADLLPCNKSFKSLLSTFLILKLPVKHGSSRTTILDNFDDIVTLPWCNPRDLKTYHASSYVDILLDENFNDVENSSLFEHLRPYLKELQNAHDYITGLNLNTEELDGDLTDSDSSEPRFNISNEARGLCEYLKHEHFYDFESGDKVLDFDTPFSNETRRSNNDVLEPHVKDFIEKDDHKMIHGYKKHILLKHNLFYDCPIFPFLPLYCHIIPGATLKVVENLINNGRPNGIGINLDGGRHHAFKDKGNGFCYINDIVLAINRFRLKNYKKIAYIDFDLHHGDGVEKAFETSSNVQTTSLHFAEYGFFPNTAQKTLFDKQKECYNIVMPRGTNDAQFMDTVSNVVLPTVHRFCPQVLVIQCGGDGLKKDDYDVWALSIQGLVNAIMRLVEQFGKHTKIVVLGGGGYRISLQSRFYAYLIYKLTAYSKSGNSSKNNLLDKDYTFEIIPEHSFSDFYRDSYQKFFV